MPSPRIFLRSSIVLTAAAVLAACAQNGATLPSSTSLAPQSHVFTPLAAPPACPGQKDKTKSSSAKETWSNKGGNFCVPSIDGWGGSITYPKPKPSVKVTVTSSTTDYKNFPQLGSGTAIFYLQFAFKSGTTFGDKINDKDGLTSSTVQNGKAYTIYGQATISGGKVKVGPCFSVATKGQYGGQIGAIGGLFEYSTSSNPATGFFEVYKGKQTKTPC
jgi:hypothetical protein